MEKLKKFRIVDKPNLMMAPALFLALVGQINLFGAKVNEIIRYLEELEEEGAIKRKKVKKKAEIIKVHSGGEDL